MAATISIHFVERIEVEPVRTTPHELNYRGEFHHRDIVIHTGDGVFRIALFANEKPAQLAILHQPVLEAAQ